MLDSRQPAWWRQRVADVNPKWCNTQYDMYCLEPPQVRWEDIGEKVQSFREHTICLGEILGQWAKPTRLKDTVRHQLLHHTRQVFWTGEYLILSCPELADNTRCRPFRGLVLPPDQLQEAARIPGELRFVVSRLHSRCEEFLQGVMEYLAGFSKVLPVPELPRLNLLVELEDDLYEARDLLSLGYVQTALLLLVRCIEASFRAVIERYFPTHPANGKQPSLDDRIKLLSSFPIPGQTRPLVSDPMKHTLATLRGMRNLVAHADDLSDPFFQDATPDLASAAMKVLVSLDAALPEDAPSSPAPSDG